MPNIYVRREIYDELLRRGFNPPEKINEIVAEWLKRNQPRQASAQPSPRPAQPQPRPQPQPQPQPRRQAQSPPEIVSGRVASVEAKTSKGGSPYYVIRLEEDGRAFYAYGGEMRALAADLQPGDQVTLTVEKRGRFWHVVEMSSP